MVFHLMRRSQDPTVHASVDVHYHSHNCCCSHLEHALLLMLPAVLGQGVPLPTTTQCWDNVCDKVLGLQKDYTERQQGTWRKIWHGVGKASGNVDVWVGWIPSDLGLAVVKAGLALVITVSGKGVQSYSLTYYQKLKSFSWQEGL